MPQTWTRSQRVVLALSVIGFAAFLGWRAYQEREIVSRPQQGEGARSGELVTQVDPNVANLAQLAMIPGMGQKRAEAIVAYRESFKKTRPGETPFRSKEDLLKVKGLGVNVVENVAPYLEFPTTQPAQ